PADEALQILVGPTRARFLRRVLAVLDPYVHEVFPAGQESLGALPRLPDSYPAVLCVRAVAAALGVNSLIVVRGTARSAALLFSDDEERKRALHAAVVFCRDLRVVAQIVAAEALAAPTAEDRRRALAANPAMTDALRFAASEACWSAHRRIYAQA